MRGRASPSLCRLSSRAAKRVVCNCSAGTCPPAPAKNFILDGMSLKQYFQRMDGKRPLASLGGVSFVSASAKGIAWQRIHEPKDALLSSKTEIRTNPFIEHLQLPPIEITDGIARLEFVVEKIHLRHGGVLHGGMYATALDTVAGYTAYGVAPPGAEIVTAQ
jgi:hypothetical protein